MDHNRRFPILFVLNTTNSMPAKDPAQEKPIIDLLNDTVQKILKDIICDNSISPYASVAFITFSDRITMETEFKKPGFFTMADFRPTVGSGQRVYMETLPYEQYGDLYFANIPRFLDFHTNASPSIGLGVLRAIEKLEQYKKNLKIQKKAYYIPLMILITDGAPMNTSDQREKDAVQAVWEHCYSPKDCSNFIIPLICGVGKDVDHLRKYSKGFPQGFQYVDSNDPESGFQEFYQFIRGSFTSDGALESLFSKESVSQKIHSKKAAEIRSLVQQLESILSND